MIKGLVLFDYDGTLVDEREEIYVPTLKTRQAIEELQRQGYLCVLATGRALSYIPRAAHQLLLDGYVTSNGASVWIHGKEIYFDAFDDEELRELIAYMEEQHINYILEGNEFCYVKDLMEEKFLHFMHNFKTPTDNFISYESMEQVTQKIGKVTLVFSNKEELEIGKETMKNKYACSMHRNCTTFDIAKIKNHKGQGARKIMEHYNIAKEDTYAFGDGDNDVELLESVQYGIAMEVHNPQLDAVATLITRSVKDEGIYKALKRLHVI